MILDADFQLLRSRVKTLEEQVDFLCKQLGVTYHPQPAGDDPRIIQLIREDQMINAIKLYRELYPSSLPEAKNAVEEMARKLGI